MNKQSWKEILCSFRDNYHILISAAILGFVFGASIAIMERIEGSTARMSQRPPVRSLTHTREVKVTVTSPQRTSNLPSAIQSNLRNPSHKSPEPLSSPYSFPKKSKYSPFVTPSSTKTFSYPIKTKRYTEKSSIIPTQKPEPTATKKPTVTQTTAISPSEQIEEPVDTPSPVIESTQPEIEEDIESNETDNPPDNGS